MPFWFRWDDFAVRMGLRPVGCIRIPKPNAEQRTALEKLSIVFFDHAPFARLPEAWSPPYLWGFSFRDYVAVRLPKMWRVIESNVVLQVSLRSRSGTSRNARRSASIRSRASTASRRCGRERFHSRLSRSNACPPCLRTSGGFFLLIYYSFFI